MFVVAYQKILQLSYVDKFLDDVHLEFRDRYKNDLSAGQHFGHFDFLDPYNETLKRAEKWAKSQAKIPKQMKTFEESVKSKKTVASMIERKGEEKKGKPEKPVEKKKEVGFVQQEVKVEVGNGALDDETMAANRLKFAQKMGKKKEGNT